MKNSYYCLYRDAYFTKSFYCLGKSISSCFNCSYCRARTNIQYNFNTVPSSLNPLFTNLPVAINLFYGDPMLQIDKTHDLLQKLNDADHKGPVVIITKGNVKSFFKNNPHYDLDLHFGLSTFGKSSIYDGSSFDLFQKNLDTLSNENIKYSIEYRPIIKDINDTDDCFDRVCKEAKQHNIGIGYCGLQVNADLRQYIKDNNLPFTPYSGHQFGMKKYIDGATKSRLMTIAKTHNVHVFNKTSCLLAYTHNMERDLNAHYYRPNEVGCKDCPMYNKCMEFKNRNTELKLKLPFNLRTVYNKKHKCALVKNGLCKFPSDDCLNISGTMLETDEKLTTTDVRIIKWLTGFTVNADFTEEPYMSDKWLMNVK